MLAGVRSTKPGSLSGAPALIWARTRPMVRITRVKGPEGAEHVAGSLTVVVSEPGGLTPLPPPTPPLPPPQAIRKTTAATAGEVINQGKTVKRIIPRRNDNPDVANLTSAG